MSRETNENKLAIKIDTIKNASQVTKLHSKDLFASAIRWNKIKTFNL